MILSKLEALIELFLLFLRLGCGSFANFVVAFAIGQIISKQGVTMRLKIPETFPKSLLMTLYFVSAGRFSIDTLMKENYGFKCNR
ncbi:Uncharacterized protein BM_BM17361 [Brugia malayi]|uniref:Uncharacterized protein n=1 Tax=Brugia malayi TaxID=6279 RepID=A0A4E9F205_BRUMA|nr:Uncharacterized protein BM_BM17361 [Brugia malayi]VIO90717.1 Uncharacterized protein BM_BM17361 [Brugia malayi]